MTRRLKLAVLGLAATVLVIGATNHFRLNRVAGQVMQPRHVQAMAYYRFGILPGTLVLDIRGVGPDSSSAATIGGVIELAERLDGRSFDKVLLAWRGQPRFLLEGGDFRRIGREAAWQNPVYTIRTLPEKLRRPDGRPAFQTWSGGVLGVLSAQMEDVNSFARQWYLQDAIARL